MARIRHAGRRPASSLSEDGEASSDIQEALNEASDLDRNLNALAEPVAQPTFRVRLNEIPDSAAPTPLLTLLWPFGNIWKPAMGLVAAALVGLFVGTIEPGLSSGVGTTDVDVLSALGWTAIGDLPELEVY